LNLLSHRGFFSPVTLAVGAFAGSLLAMAGPASAQSTPKFQIVADNGQCLTRGGLNQVWEVYPIVFLSDCSPLNTSPADQQKFDFPVDSTNYPFNASTPIHIGPYGGFLKFGSGEPAHLEGVAHNLTIRAPNDAWHLRAYEGGFFTLGGPGTTPVRYGLEVNHGQEFFNTLSLPPGTVNCNNATFGDPISGPGPGQRCESLADFRANEGGSFTLATQTQVRYGAEVNGQEFFNTLSLPPGTVNCNNATFGEPIYGTVKHCESVGTSRVTISNPNRECLARLNPMQLTTTTTLPASECFDHNAPEAAKWTLVPLD
jgi:hypothetical protein